MPPHHAPQHRCWATGAGDRDDEGGGRPEKEEDQEYRNTATRVLSNFMSSSGEARGGAIDEEFNSIDWDAPKINKVPLETLAQALDAELYVKEWFVTGNINPQYFSKNFMFRDPDVQITGIQKYAEGVRKIFDQQTARAEIVSTTVSAERPNDTITCTWRLSGKVNIGPTGLTIKPYIVYTDFTVDEKTGLVVFQEDRFDRPGWDILLSALFPFLIGKLTSDPAPPPEPRAAPPKVPAGVL